MSDTPVPASPTKQPSTILGRLSQAIRQQNWFAVWLEVGIVIVGVVIGFQVQGWGQARANEDKEHAYLLQLAEDLRATQSLILMADAGTRPHDIATSKLVRAFFAPESPPADSILQWRLLSMRFRPLILVTGTADALIASGDLALIQNDTLRSEITSYTPFVQARLASAESDVLLWWAEAKAFSNRYDPGDVLIRTLDADVLDSMALANPYNIVPAGDRRRPFPIDVRALLNDREAYNHVRAMLSHKAGINRERTLVWDASHDLLDLIEAELTTRWGTAPVPRPEPRVDGTGVRLFEVEQVELGR